MSDKEQAKDEQKKVSKLEVEKTYGEKIHSFIFDQALNFWANLILSGMFNHWAHNRSEPLKLLGNKSPMDYYEGTRGWIRNRLPEGMRGPKGPATAMANTFTLSIPGHIIMIPSVWLGAKIKAPMVEWIDRWHYGKDSQDDPHLMERHHAIETEAKPTLFGSVVGRIGTALALQLTAFSIGANQNWIQGAGKLVGSKTLQSYPGIDPIAEEIGAHAGVAAGQMMGEKNRNAVDTFARDKLKLGWSEDQRTEAAFGDKYGKGTFFNADTSKPYNFFMQDLGRYISLDILYTLVTAATVHPIINAVKKVLPGMTYTPHPKHVTPLPSELADKPKTSPRAQRDEEDMDDTQPKRTVSKVENLSTVSDRAAQLGANT